MPDEEVSDKSDEDYDDGSYPARIISNQSGRLSFDKCDMNDPDFDICDNFGRRNATVINTNVPQPR